MVTIIKESFGQNNEHQISSKWWLQPEDEMHKHIFPVCKHIYANQQTRRALYNRFNQMYLNTTYIWLEKLIMNSSNFIMDISSFNIVKSCVDTLQAKIGKMKPRPLFLTEDGNWSLRQRAKKLTQYLDGFFDEDKTYTKGREAFKDAGIFGTGCIKILPMNGRIVTERVVIDELIVDDYEGEYCEPRQMHQRKRISKEVLKDMFPKFKELIDAAPTVIKSQTTSDAVVVVESWHLRSGEKSKDGKHVISIENATLFVEDWNKDYFPFSFYRYNKAPRGFWGIGIAENQMGKQKAINNIMSKIERAIDLVATPRVWVEKSSEVNTAHINNEIGSVVKYTGQAPTFHTPTLLSPEVYQHLERLIIKAYQEEGISELSSQSQKPAGLNSAVALREYQDIETERFAATALSYEEFYMDIAEKVIDMTDDLQTSGSAQKVKAKTNKFMKTINWKEVNIEQDKYSMRIFPTSLLPTQPSAKLQTVDELVQRGYLDPAYAKSLLDFPDLEKAINLDNAAFETILMFIDKMIDDGEYNAPEPYMNLDLAQKLTQASIQKYKMDGADEDRLDLLRQFLQDILELKNPPAQLGVDNYGASDITTAGGPVANVPTTDPVIPAGTPIEGVPAVA